MARGGGLGCYTGLNGPVGIISTHTHERERLAKWFWRKLVANAYLKRASACLLDDVLGGWLLIIYMGHGFIQGIQLNILC